MARKRSYRRKRPSRKVRRMRRSYKRSYKRSRSYKKRGIGRKKRTTLRTSQTRPFTRTRLPKSGVSNRKVSIFNNSQQAKLLKSIIRSVTYRFGGINNYEINPSVSQTGFYGLYNHMNSNDTVQYMPIHIYDLTAVMQKFPISPYQVVIPKPGYALTKSVTVSSQKYSWYHIEGQPPTAGVNDENLQYVGSTNQDVTVGPKGIFDGFNVKFLLRGARNYPVTYYIDLVQFHKDVHPHIPSSGDPAQGGVDDIGKWPISDSFWEYMCKPLMGNPIAETGYTSNIRNKMKVIRSIKVELQADNTNDMDSNPVSKVINFYHRFNRSVNYAWWKNTAKFGVLNPQYYTGDNDQFDQVLSVVPEARIYLMIRANNPNVFGPYNGNNLHMPSYDMAYTTKFTSLGFDV